MELKLDTTFPMIVNSDERQWTWMDEGLNSFMVYGGTN
jgi:hypothetical protein